MSDGATAEARASASGFPPGAEGVSPPTDQAPRGGFLSDLIIELGFADEKAVEDALGTARQSGRSPEAVLLQTGKLTEEQLARAVAERHGLDYVDLAVFQPDAGAAGLVGRATATRYGAVPVAFAGDDALIVAVHDPVDGLAIDDIAVITKSEVRVAVATRAAINEVIDRLVPEDVPPRSEPDLDAGANGSGDADGAIEPAAAAPQIFADPAAPADSDGDDEDAARLLAELAAAKSALDAASGERDSLSSERDALRAEVERQAEELERLASEQSSAASENEDAVAAAGEQAKELEAKLEEVTKERERLRADLDERAADTTASDEASAAREEAERLRAELEASARERDDLRAELGRRAEELEKVASEQTSKASESEEAVEAAGKKAKKLKVELEETARERDSLVSERDELRAEAERLAAELSERSEQDSAGEAAANAAREEVDRLKAELSTVVAQVAALEAERTSVTVERDELRDEIEKLRGEVAEVASHVDAELPAGPESYLGEQLESIREAAERAGETALRERADSEQAMQKLRDNLDQANRRNHVLEERLAKLAAAADEARAASEKLAELSRRS